ncbi:hypothetical protein RHSIM_Rhsim04G0195500 [Rhododendron simsii]|uniref:SWIM-type domain-containing protein n=1 Tax=Rhododendron simsii TaxID=118357 RepID=A0A834H3K2_RHOSS|nr:hypothetical protein RHSIM_Rhsim04G0195500 [Rhododendron simsii]
MVEAWIFGVVARSDSGGSVAAVIGWWAGLGFWFSMVSENKNFILLAGLLNGKIEVVFLTTFLYTFAMEGGLILACRYNEKFAAIMINRGMNFGQVVHKICSKWSDLDPESIMLSYSLIGSENIVLDNDEDLGALFGIVQTAGIEDIEVLVRDATQELGMGEGRNGANINLLGSIGPIGSQSIGSGVGTQVEACDMVIPSFFTHEKRVLKSAQWAEGITNVGQRFEGGVSQFRQVLRKYAIERGIEYVLAKNDKERVTAQCKYRVEGPCKWEVHGRVCIFPLCYAVVDSENHENWLWFLKHLHSILAADRGITFVSDRNQGLLEAVRMVFPNSCHGYCLFHLKWNLRHHLRGTQPGFKAYLVNLMLRCAYAPTRELFYDNMRNLIAYGGNRVNGFLSNLQPQHWANAFFPGQRYGEMYSHVAESFNSWIEEERYLPIKPLVDAIRVKVMNLIVERREIASKWAGKICPQMDKRLTDCFYDSRTWVVSESGYGVYEVHAQPTVTVDIGNRSCSCKQWQQDGFPCCHAVGTITSSGKYLVDYVDPYYYSQTFRDSYSYSISPIPTVWMPQRPIDEDVVLPPLSKKPPGRPKKKRIPSRGEPTEQIKCGRCHKFGNHNRKTCKEAMYC